MWGNTSNASLTTRGNPLPSYLPPTNRCSRFWGKGVYHSKGDRLRKYLVSKTQFVTDHPWINCLISTSLFSFLFWPSDYNWDFWFFQKHKKCCYFHNFGRLCLVKKLVLTFSAPIKYAKAQFNSRNNSIESYGVYDLQTDRHFRKNRFFWLKG